MILRCFFIIAMVLILTQCKKSEPLEIHYPKTFFYDSISQEKIYIYDYEGFKNRLKTNQDSLYLYSFFATYHPKSIRFSKRLDSLISSSNKKMKLTYVSLDFYSGARDKLLEFNRESSSDLILLYEPNNANWFKEYDAMWDYAPNRLLMVTNDSIKMINQEKVAIEKNFFTAYQDSLTN